MKKILFDKACRDCKSQKFFSVERCMSCRHFAANPLKKDLYVPTKSDCIRWRKKHNKESAESASYKLRNHDNVDIYTDNDIAYYNLACKILKRHFYYIQQRLSNNPSETHEFLIKIKNNAIKITARMY